MLRAGVCTVVQTCKLPSPVVLQWAAFCHEVTVGCHEFIVAEAVCSMMLSQHGVAAGFLLANVDRPW